MKHYCLGFVFDEEMEHVVLIEKKRLVWQAGKINGVGGHVTPGESYVGAMQREFREEAGADIPEARWVAFSSIRGDKPSKECADCENMSWTCMCFVAALSLAEFDFVTTQTDEQIVICEVGDIDTERVPLDNLRWLIPAAIEAYRDGELTLIARYSIPELLQKDARVCPSGG